MDLWRHVPTESLAELIEVGVDLAGATRCQHYQREALLSALEDSFNGRIDHWITGLGTERVYR